MLFRCHYYDVSESNHQYLLLTSLNKLLGNLDNVKQCIISCKLKWELVGSSYRVIKQLMSLKSITNSNSFIPDIASVYLLSWICSIHLIVSYRQSNTDGTYLTAVNWKMKNPMLMKKVITHFILKSLIKAKIQMSNSPLSNNRFSMIRL